MKRELIMYTRTSSCPFVTLAKRVLNDYHVEYREVFIDKDDQARQQVLAWTGFLSVPTLVAAEDGSLLPYEEPSALARGTSPRGIDRGAMITEPGIDELSRWLQRHGFITEIATTD
jgi:glutaredoxin